MVQSSIYLACLRLTANLQIAAGPRQHSDS
jgi:hypothetical protein